MKTFKFNYFTAKYKIIIDNDILNVKMGLVNKDIPLQSIQYIYVKRYEQYNEIIIRYDNKGKIKNYKLNFSDDQTEAISFVDYLIENTNAKDLRGLPEKEAMETLKAADMMKVGFIIAFVIMMIIPTVMFLPAIGHYFDNGQANVTLSQIINNEDIGTSNVTVNGTVVNAGLWVESTSSDRNGTTTTTNNYFPLVNENWTKDKPVKVILETGDVTQGEINELVDKTSFTGILENKFWEGGLDDENKEFFLAEYGITISDDVVILNISSKSYGVSMIIYLIVLVILIGVMIFLKIKKNK